MSPENSAEVVIGEIFIANGDVFDLEDSQNDGFLHRFMNALHVQTDEAVIRRQLLFSEGDVVDESDISETARYLRANRYLANAEVSPINCEHGHIDVQVKTTDSWSLIPSISFSRKGGQNFGGLEIQETNLFGSGSELKLSYDSDIERDLLGLRYADRQLGDSRTGLLVSLEDYEDGYRNKLEVGQPFYSLNAARAAGLSLDIFDQLDGLYSLGERVSDIRHRSQQYSAYFGWSQGLNNGRVTRWTAGIGYDQHEFEPVDDTILRWRLPSDRRDVYPFLGVEWLENKYEKTRDQDQMARIEDRHLGTRLSMQLGYAAKAFGSMQDALRFEAAASRGFRPVRNGTLMLTSDFEWRNSQSERPSYLLRANARYYHQQTEKRLFFAQLSIAAGENLDTDRQLALGGDSGLRAYPVRYLNGDTLALLTLEQRFHTDWYPFGLFRVGAAAFLDAGTVGGSSRYEPSVSGAYKNAGVGLRIGSPHSATGRILHFDVAYAMDGPPDVRGWQLYIESRTSF